MAMSIFPSSAVLSVQMPRAWQRQPGGRQGPKRGSAWFWSASSVPTVGGPRLRGAAVPARGPSPRSSDRRGDAGMDSGFGVSSCVPSSALEIKNQSDYSSP